MEKLLGDAMLHVEMKIRLKIVISVLIGVALINGMCDHIFYVDMNSLWRV